MNEDHNLHPPGLARLSLWSKRQIKEQAPRSRCGHFLLLRMGRRPLRARAPAKGLGLADGGGARRGWAGVIMTTPPQRPRPSGGPSPPISGPGCPPRPVRSDLAAAQPGAGGPEEQREEGGAERAQRRAQSPMSRAEPAPPRTPARCSPSPRPTWCQVREQVRVRRSGPPTQIFLRSRCYAGQRLGVHLALPAPGVE